MEGVEDHLLCWNGWLPRVSQESRQGTVTNPVDPIACPPAESCFHTRPDTPTGVTGTKEPVVELVPNWPRSLAPARAVGGWGGSNWRVGRQGGPRCIARSHCLPNPRAVQTQMRYHCCPTHPSRVPGCQGLLRRRRVATLRFAWESGISQCPAHKHNLPGATSAAHSSLRHSHRYVRVNPQGGASTLPAVKEMKLSGT